MDIIKQLKEADDLYYNSGTSPLSDAEYDTLKEMAEGLYPNDPYFVSVGAKVKSSNKIDFNGLVIGSLKKYKPDTIMEYLGKFSSEEIFRITPKLDGMSIISTFENAQHILSASRGDGYFGENITNKFSHIDFNISRKISCKLRGEVILRGDSYKTLGYMNRRNGIVGLVGDDKNTNSKFIDVVFYEIINCSDSNLELSDIFKNPDFYVPELIIKNKNLSVEFLVDYYKKLKNNMDDVDIDGLVIEPKDWVRENVDRPKNKIAFKVNDLPVRAIVDYIEWSTSRTGRVVPVINLKEKILLSGAMVGRASGFNADFIISNKIGPSSEIGIVRSGEVIPHVVEIYTKSPFYTPLTFCPSCGQEIKKVGVDYICSNDECGNMQYLKIQHWLTELGAEQVKEATLVALGVNTLDKLYSLTTSDILSSEGFGERSANVIISEIQKTLTSTPEKLLAAMGIPGIGTRVAEKIYSHLRKCWPESNEEEIFAAMYTYNDHGLDDLQNIDGIGMSIVMKLENSCSQMKETYELIKKYGFTFKEKKTISNMNGGHMLSEKRIAMTGAGPLPRKQLEEMISAAGGINASISKDTDILVCADPNSGSSKLQKATKFGTRIISYEELMFQLIS